VQRARERERETDNMREIDETERKKRFNVGRQSEGPGVSMCSGTTPTPSISKPINVWVGKLLVISLWLF
jgi:hypothetical protein